ncbi:MAG: polysaccharide deacetylase family protein [Clostridia bacterium]|nr:polysaccharide deacetylase family protein [Clostridia bacterium]
MKVIKKGALAVNALILSAVLAVGFVCFFPATLPASSKEEGVYYVGTAETGVSLMFNVYEGTEIVEGILDVLKENGVKATFFLGGCWADDNVPTVVRMRDEGHEIGSHGYFHRDHSQLSYEKNVEEIKASLDFLERVTGERPQLFAPPSGAYSDETVSASKQLNCRVVMWSKDTVDWRDHDKAVCFRRATEEAKGGDLILMHPKAHTLQALPDVLAYYKAQGLQAITVGENIG